MDKIYFNLDESLAYIMRSKYFLSKKELDNLDKQLIIIVGNIIKEQSKKKQKRGKR